MAGIIEGFILGALAGLFARPILDAYLTWKTTQTYRRLDDTDRNRHGANV